MGQCDTYKQLKSEKMDKLFSRLYELREEKTKIDKEIKEIENEYKPSLEGLQGDLFYETSNHIKFSIKLSQRAGSIDTKAMSKDGIDIEKYRKKPTTIKTLRFEKE